MKLRMLAIAMTFTVLASAAQAIDLRVLSSWDISYPARSVLLDQFVKNVETASKGDMKFIISGPETVPPFEQLQPVGSGVFQFLFSHAAYHFGNTPYLIPMDGLTGDSKKWRESGLYEMIDKHYQRFGLKLLFLAKTPENTAYQIILRNPVSASGDLQGRKVRGTQTYSGVFSLLGASPVVLPPSEIYTALEKGVVDGAAWPVVGVLGYRWYEAAKYLLRPSFGVAAYCMFVNISAWNGLTEGQRQLLRDEGIKAETFWEPEWIKIAKEEETALLAKGVQLTEMGAAQKAKLGVAFEQGLWDLSLSKDARSIGELREFSKKNGLSN